MRGRLDLVYIDTRNGEMLVIDFSFPHSEEQASLVELLGTGYYMFILLSLFKISHFFISQYLSAY